MRLPFVVTLVAAAGLSAAAQYPPDTNVDESRVPAYTLPDPLTMESGEPVGDADAWRRRRRPELLRLFETHVYGRTPGATADVTAGEVDVARGVLGGKATRKQVTLRFRRNGRELPVDLLVYLPANASGPVPVVVALNFRGNQSISADPGIRLATSWLPDRNPGVADNRATDASRGTAASRWPVETIVGRGYALATAYYGDIDPDFDDGFANGVHPLFLQPGQQRPADGEWGAIGAWAWGLSRMLDYLETDADIDARRAAVFGHSRLGKTALWAAAQDERFALAISNDSGCGGAAISRRRFGETVAHITRSFPHWFTPRFATYANREPELPVDQHQLLALVAPRPLYVASAAEDLWADPRGEFLGALGAEPVYRLLGREGLGTSAWPPIDTPVGGTIGYHVRRGGHDVTPYDWQQYLAFADRHLGAPRGESR